MRQGPATRTISPLATPLRIEAGRPAATRTSAETGGRSARTLAAPESKRCLFPCSSPSGAPDSSPSAGGPGWKGICEAGENFSADDCNNKVIGARFYVDGFIAGGPLDEDDFISPLDFSDHGTHTATTAGGNRVDNAELSGIDVGTVSGMAPDAWLSVYKTCWRRPGASTFSCALSDLIGAIDQATADGVDVINYSIGSTAP